ncbi:MAG: DUF4340 domain-containing protein [Planctomycetes bacterium]|nr:DUF4340 domain-containing protein [Planctomycetota bacterium]
MNPKTLIVLGATLAVLIAAWLLMPDPAANMEGIRGLELKPGQPLFPDFRIDDAQAIVMVQQGRTVALRRKIDKEWVLASHDDRAVQWARVEKLLEGIRKATFVQPRLGENELFELDDKRRTEVVVMGSGTEPLAKLVVGKSPQFERCYVLRGDDEKVLEVDANFDELAGHKMEGERRELKQEYWYDLALLRFKAGDAIDIVLEQGAKTYRLRRFVEGKGPLNPGDTFPKPPEPRTGAGGEETRQEGPKLFWKLVEPEEALANDGTVRAICSTAAWLNAKSYADDLPREALGIQPPAATTKITLIDGTVFRLRFGQVGEDYAVAQVEGRKDVFKLEKYVHMALVPDPERLKERAPEIPLDPSPRLPGPPEVPAPPPERPAPPRIEERPAPPHIPPVPKKTQAPEYETPGAGK